MKNAHISIAITDEEFALIRKYRKKYGNVSLAIRTILKRYDDIMQNLASYAEKDVEESKEVTKEELINAVLQAGPELAVRVIDSSPIGTDSGSSLVMSTAITDYIEGLI